jgi:pyruvate/2-oxoglutarate dehydrogenase complex dihydrolipoamide dehydrogenase (E3) component
VDFDVIVIGTGQAGVPLSTRLARGGKTVLLAERSQLGGTCTHTGCTPTKTLVASARAAHVARRGARLGIRTEAVHVDGFVPVDDRYATSAPGVYAVGDCTGGPQFTHTAWDDHRLLFDILAGRGDRGRKDRLVPHTAYTDPQVAAVGLTERDARETGVRYEVASLAFAWMAGPGRCHPGHGGG